jgi:mannose-6-phosphate isomerase-like protein (cupin superfamily)
MRKLVLFLFFLLLLMCGYGQLPIKIDTICEPLKFENVCVQKISDDSLQTTFVIWIKKGVPEHYHLTHTENIYVLEGRAQMTINGVRQQVKKGDYLTIPMGTKHAVTQVISRKPLKVLSIQSPRFDGSDRIIIKNLD